MNIQPASAFASNKDGVYRNVPDREYHALDRCSKSRLSKMKDRSPMHMRHDVENPTATPAMMFGRGIHAYLASPDDFLHEWGVFDGSLRSNAGKEEWARMEEHFGDQIVRTDDYDLIQRINTALMNTETVQAILDCDPDQIERELTILWTEPNTRLQMKSRIDLWQMILGLNIDWKSARDASPAAINRQAAQLDYDLQAAMYRVALRQHGAEVNASVFVCFEKEDPIGVGFYQAYDIDCDMAYKAAIPLFKQYKACEDSGVWPGYPDEIVRLELPEWHSRRLEMVIENAI